MFFQEKRKEKLITILLSSLFQIYTSSNLSEVTTFGVVD